MRFRVLGAVELVAPDGARRPIGSPNQRVVLAVLLAHRAQVVPVDTLVESLWPREPPDTALTTLRTYVSRLRKAVGSALVTHPGGYALEVDASQVDAGRFDELCTRSPAEPADTAVDAMTEALGLWRGSAFGAEADLETVRPEAIRLEERRSWARQALAEALLRAGRAGDAVALAEGLLVAEPLREPAWRVLVLALAAEGRPADALRAYQRAARALADAGLEPSAALRAAEQHVLVGADVGAPVIAPRPGAAPERGVDERNPSARRAPRRASSFIGREADLASVLGLLDRQRVVTLLGPGGVGKTRLAMEVAHELASSAPDGAVWVELSTLHEDGSVVDAVAAAVDLPGARPATSTLAAAARQEALLVLDNAEHVLDGVSAVATQLLDGGSEMRILITSRERVGIDGEHVVDIAPLVTTGEDPPARRLLLDRAAAAGSAVGLADRPEVVDRLVRRLDGLPLAIEMAAAQLPTTSIEELVEVAEGGSGELRAPARGAPARHRSLAAVLEWSEHGLEPDERELFAELSTFAGSFTIADAARVLGRPGLDHAVRRLAERSLLVADPTESPARFRLLQTVRDHAAAQLMVAGRTGEVAHRHAAWCAAELESSDVGLRGVHEGAARRRIDAVFDEVRTAHAWARAHEPQLAGQMTRRLHVYARTGMVDEPLAWAELLHASGGPVSEEPAVLASCAARAVTRGDLTAAVALTDRFLHDESGPWPAEVVVLPLEVLGDALLFAGRVDESEQAYRRLAACAAACGDEYHEVLGLVGVGLARVYSGHPDRALSLLPELVRRTAVAPTTAAWVEYLQGEVLPDQRPEQALAHLERSERLAASAASTFLVSIASASATSLLARVGDLDDAVDRFCEVLTRWDEVRDLTHQTTTLRNVSVLLRRLDLPELAARVLGVVSGAEVPTYGDEERRLEEVRNWTVDRLGQDTSAALAAEGSGADVFRTADLVLEALLDRRSRQGFSALR